MMGAGRRDRDGGPLCRVAIQRHRVRHLGRGAPGFIWIFTTAQARWFDLIAGTVAIKAPEEDVRAEFIPPTYSGRMGEAGDPTQLPD
jgi:hypothetical protein